MYIMMVSSISTAEVIHPLNTEVPISLSSRELSSGELSSGELEVFWKKTTVASDKSQNTNFCCFHATHTTKRPKLVR